MSGGILLVLAGVWVATQVLAGDALQRLDIAGDQEETTEDYNVDPDTGVPNQDPGKPYLRDPEGRVY